MFGWYDITPSKSGGSAEIKNTYWHDRSAFLWRSEHKVGAAWSRKFKCDNDGNVQYVDGEGPRATPSFKDGIAYAHMKVIVEGEGTKKAHISVQVKTGANATVTITSSGSAEVGAGGHEGSVGGKITLGTSMSWTGSLGVEKGTTKDWYISCVCKE